MDVVTSAFAHSKCAFPRLFSWFDRLQGNELTPVALHDVESINHWVSPLSNLSALELSHPTHIYDYEFQVRGDTASWDDGTFKSWGPNAQS